MTTIIGIQGSGWAVMAADSQITEENSKIISSATPKIIKYKNLLIGLRGDARPGDIIAHSWTPPRITESPKKWIVDKMVPSMIEIFDYHRYDWKEKEADFSFMVCVKGEIFDVGSDFSISRSDYGVYGAGTGKDLAVGCVSGQKQILGEIDLEKAKALAYTAVEIASRFDVNTSAPIQVEVMTK